jgi:hypothetical protein
MTEDQLRRAAPLCAEASTVPTSQWPAVFAGAGRSCLRTRVNVRRRAAEHRAGDRTGIKPAERDEREREKRAAHP